MNGNYTETPNALFDLDLASMGEAELKITLAVIRKTLGWHATDPVPFTYTELMAATGLSKQGVRNGLKAALLRGRVTRVQGDNHTDFRYDVDYGLREMQPVAEQSTREGSESTKLTAPPPGSTSLTQEQR